jgi:hypothetical protein
LDGHRTGCLWLDPIDSKIVPLFRENDPDADGWLIEMGVFSLWHTTGERSSDRDHEATQVTTLIQML